MLNNTDSVLKKGEVEGAIQDYEALFAGARTEVCKCHGEFRTRGVLIVHVHRRGTLRY